ncbi:hypothetical protein MKL42_03955 [Acinetobacter sp. AOR15_HL]|jgi:hypothetical protein|uniref:hypothetical protein n=1 Tax=unclassified Acinetobacter TaxID=196816 RepID=UPI0022EB0A38|nr:MULTISPECIES: hypothetical protein [unclassified Acinetobacter]MDA3556673.1 hypothetical protein [Acinetobacter sp. AOR15_HL]MDA3573335.1 hypothetical protein [Acinetobacter sp. AOR14_HL]
MNFYLIFFPFFIVSFVSFVVKFFDYSEKQRQAPYESIEFEVFKEKKRGFGWAIATTVLLAAFLVVFFTSFNLITLGALLIFIMICSNQSFERFQRADHLSKLAHVNNSSF